MTRCMRTAEPEPDKAAAEAIFGGMRVLNADAMAGGRSVEIPTRVSTFGQATS